MQKQQMLIPLIVPFIIQRAKDIEDTASKWDYSTLFLSNDGAGVATTIDMSWYMINAHEYDGFQFHTDKIKIPSLNLYSPSFKREEYPVYGMRLELMYLNYKCDKFLRFQVTQGKLNSEQKIKREGLTKEEREKKVKITGGYRISNITSELPIRMGTLKNGELSTFDLPWHYRVLTQQFFIERVLDPAEYTQLSGDVTEEIKG
ncbi:hypothetical protein [Exiguobacterium acetylicum]|uniref:hypothetical protein n=1 Tax=Exiguobacterium acetylicum TaxID=41170 RepID=UPI001CA7032E|nr:hypothetical protein [Exiguobacterium acetylicum]QZY88557.1 hypothetical protein K7G97_16605 [Exiguobacterium acetylicum]